MKNLAPSADAGAGTGGEGDLTEEEMKKRQEAEEANKGQHQENKDKMLKQQMKVFGAGARRRSLGTKGKKKGWINELQMSLMTTTA